MLGRTSRRGRRKSKSMAREDVVINRGSIMIETLCRELQVSHSLNPQQSCRWVVLATVYGLSLNNMSKVSHPAKVADLPFFFKAPCSFLSHDTGGCNKEGGTRVQKSLLLQVTSATWADAKFMGFDHCRCKSVGVAGLLTSSLGWPHWAGHTMETWKRRLFKMEHGKQRQWFNCTMNCGQKRSLATNSFSCWAQDTEDLL